jgi:hypothetical protein
MKKVFFIALLFFCCFWNSLFAQDTLYRKNNFYFGYKLTNELFYFWEEGDKDGSLSASEYNYKLSSKVFYFKYVRQTNYEYELGVTTALSLGDVHNDVYCNGQYIYPCKAQRKRFSFSLMLRYNYPVIRKKHLDIYYGGGLGMRITSYYDYTDNVPRVEDDDLLRIFWPIAVEGVGGIRFYPIKNIGLYIEAGLAKTLVQGGLLIAW